jgi:hypothetical protein
VDLWKIRWISARPAYRQELGRSCWNSDFADLALTDLVSIDVQTARLGYPHHVLVDGRLVNWPHGELHNTESYHSIQTVSTQSL